MVTASSQLPDVGMDELSVPLGQVADLLHDLRPCQSVLSVLAKWVSG